jgi:ADP-ribose pyrophosphatase
MSTLADYLALTKERPELFQNPSHDGIEILLDENEIREIEAQMEAKGLPFEQARVGIIYQDAYLRAIRDAVLFPDGKKGIYLRLIDPVDHAPGVIVLPVYKGQVLLIRHFRHATRRWHLEIPRGFGAKGFSDEENIRRELQEEIGGTASRLISLGQLHPNTGMTSESDELFFAEVESYGDAEIGEAITDILPTPLPEFERMIRDNEITDGFTLAAYTRAKLQGLL